MKQKLTAQKLLSQLQKIPRKQRRELEVHDVNGLCLTAEVELDWIGSGFLAKDVKIFLIK